jgi:AcrR family transcriptional regulator
MGNLKTTRERILDTGLAMASQGGLEAVTLGVLASNVGMSKSGLFAHFDSKEGVQISLLEHSATFAKASVVAPAMKEAEGLPRLKALVNLWFGWAKRAGLPGGCPVAAGIFEFDDVESPVRDKIEQMEAEWRVLLETLVVQAMKRGHLRRDLDVEQFVWELFGIYLSHHASSRFLKDPDSDTRAQTAFAALLTRAAKTTRTANPRSGTSAARKKR